VRNPYRTCSIFLAQRTAIGLLAALAAPTASKGSSSLMDRRIRKLIVFHIPEQLRIASDLMYLYFIIDDQTDIESVSVVRGLIDIMIDALNNPDKPRPEGEDALGRIVKEFVMLYACACGWQLIFLFAASGNAH